MSKKQLNKFVRDLRKLADDHDVRIGFVTVDDCGRNVCACCGIEKDDELVNGHLESLKMAIMKLRDE